MKTQAIPAQITTVEDHIAGNLNLTQMILLLVPVFALLLIYALLPAPMHLSLYKVPLILSISLLCIILAIRLKRKVIINWVVILLKYNLRPAFYVYDKNEAYLRSFSLPDSKRKASKHSAHLKAIKPEQIRTTTPLTDFIRLDDLLTNPNFSLSFRTGRKGGFNVSLKQKPQ